MRLQTALVRGKGGDDSRPLVQKGAWYAASHIQAQRFYTQQDARAHARLRAGIGAQYPCRQTGDTVPDI